jgi:hypothetical protein
MPVGNDQLTRASEASLDEKQTPLQGENEEDDEDDKNWHEILSHALPPGAPHDSDARRCTFCHSHGDRPVEGVLLYAGIEHGHLGGWAHANCAMWSAETYESETERGYLMDVHKAVSRGKLSTCEWCGKGGATIGCQKSTCKSTFHFTCALKAQCLFLHSKKVYCKKHKQSAYCDSRALRTQRQFQSYAGNRRLLIAPRPPPPRVGKEYDLDVAGTAESVRCNEAADKVKHGGRLCLRIGSLSVIQFGRVRYESSLFHTRNSVYSVGYKAIRRFWSAPAISPAVTEIHSTHTATSAVSEESDDWEGGEDMNIDINGNPVAPPQMQQKEQSGFSTPPTQPRRSDWILDVYAGRDGGFPCFRATCSDSKRTFVGDSPDAVYRQVLMFAPLSVRKVVEAAATEAGQHHGHSGGSNSGGDGDGGASGEHAESIYTPEVLARTAASAELMSAQPLFLQGLSGGDDFFGFTKLSVRAVLERLPDVAGCRGYAFRTLARTNASNPTFNVSGCARTEQHQWENRASAEVLLQPRRRLTKNVHTQQPADGPTAAPSSSLPPTKGSKRRTGGASVDQPGSVDDLGSSTVKEVGRDADGDLSKVAESERTADILLDGLAPAQASALYRLMKKHVHSRVVVRSSKIHAWGLFAKTPFKPHEMVIEYTGLILRMQVADRSVRNAHSLCFRLQAVHIARLSCLRVRNSHLLAYSRCGCCSFGVP